MSKQFTKGQRVLVEGIVLIPDDNGELEHKVQISGVGSFWVHEKDLHPATAATACEPEVLREGTNAEALCWEDVEFATPNAPNVWTACNYKGLTLDDWTTWLDDCTYRHKDTHAAVSAEDLLAAVNRAKAQPEETYTEWRQREGRSAPAHPTATQVAQAAEVYAGMQRQEFWVAFAAACLVEDTSTTRGAADAADAMLAEFDKRFGKGGA